MKLHCNYTAIAIHRARYTVKFHCNYTVIAIHCARYTVKLHCNYTVIAIHCITLKLPRREFGTSRSARSLVGQVSARSAPKGNTAKIESRGYWEMFRLSELEHHVPNTISRKSARARSCLLNLYTAHSPTPTPFDENQADLAGKGVSTEPYSPDRRRMNAFFASQ